MFKNLYSAVLDHFKKFNLQGLSKYYYFSSIFDWPHFHPPYHYGIDIHESKSVLYNPEISEEPYIYIHFLNIQRNT